MRWSCLAVLPLVSCMLSPESGQQVPSSGVVTFNGAGTSAGQTFDIRTSATAAGPFVSLGTVQTNGNPIPGTDLYAWSFEGTVPAWTDLGGCQQEAFVQVAVGQYSALTFDQGNGLSCILDETNGGLDVYNAALACQSDDSPIARITRQQRTTHTGNVVISTQAQADMLGCVGTIDGTLTIADNPAALSISLPTLESVTGDVHLAYSRAPGSTSFPTIRTIDLSALANIGGDLDVTYSGLSGDVIDLTMQLDALTSVGGDVDVHATTFNLDLMGLGALTSIPGNLSVFSSGDDYTAFGFLGALTSVGGDVSLEAGHTTTGVWPDLVSIGGDLALAEVYLPPGTTNLESLQTVAGNVSFTSLDAISFPGSDPHLPALTSVGGTLEFDGVRSFERLAVGDESAGLTVDALRLNANPALDVLLPTHVEVLGSGAIEITNHSDVTTCEAAAFATHQGTLGWSGALTNTGNAGC